MGRVHDEPPLSLVHSFMSDIFKAFCNSKHKILGMENDLGFSLSKKITKKIDKKIIWDCCTNCQKGTGESKIS